MAYTGGYTSAVNDASARAQNDAYIKQALQALAFNQWKQQQIEQETQRQQAARAKAGEFLLQQSGPPPVQPPMPGQPSVPAPPPVQPMPGMGAPAAAMFQQALQSPQGAPPGPPMGGMPPQAAPGAMPQQPQGWRPSPVAPPQLGGAPPGAAAQAGPAPAGASAPLAPPPPGSPPPMGGATAPGGAPPGMGGGTIPGQMLSVPNVLAAMKQQGVPPEQALDILDQMMPAIDKGNREALEAQRMELAAQKAAIQAYQATIAEYRAKTQAIDVDSKVDRRKAATEQGNRKLDQAAGKGGATAGDSYANLPPERQKAVDFYADMSLGGDQSWRTGLGRIAGGAQLIKQVDERVPTRAADLGLTAADVGTNKAKRAASQSAYTQITKDLTAIEPFAKMLDQNIDILKGLAQKVIKTNSALANKPLNWLQANVGDNADYADFVAQMRLVQTEAARVITNPRLVGQLTDTARKEIEEVASGNMPIGMTERVLDRLKNDGDRRLALMKEQQKSLESTIGSMTPGGRGKGAAAAPAAADMPTTRADGWTLKVDKDGNRAYVSPDGKQFDPI